MTSDWRKRRVGEMVFLRSIHEEAFTAAAAGTAAVKLLLASKNGKKQSRLGPIGKALKDLE